MAITATKAIRSNAHRKLARILETARDARRYALDDGFVGQDLTPEQIANAIRWHRSHGLGDLRTDGAGGYVFSVHSNLWFEFRAEAA